MPPGIGYANDLELGAIDDLLGDDEEQRKKRSPFREAAPGPTVDARDDINTQIKFPGLEPSRDDTPFMPHLVNDPLAGMGGPVETPFMPRIIPDAGAPSGLMDDPTLVGARGGATTMQTPTPTPVSPLEPPTGVLAPTPEPPTPTPSGPPPTVSQPAPVGSTAPRASSADSGGGRGASSWEEGYQMMRSLDPNLPQAEMEAALEGIFGGLPGYGGVYKESVRRGGRWQDLVGGYGGPNAQWQVLDKKGGSGVGFLGMDSATGLPQIDDESRLDAILASIDAMARGENSPLVNKEIDQLLAQATPQIAAQVAPIIQQQTQNERARTRQPQGRVRSVQ